MKNYIEQRVLEIAKFMLKNNATVRECAKRFGISKSTVHKDITERLPELNKELFEEVKKILATNKAERHLRGGEATKQKYAHTNAEIANTNDKRLLEKKFEKIGKK